MKYFGVFGHMTKSCKFVEGMGSDSVIRLDGRNTLENMRLTCQKRIGRMQSLHDYDAFNIVRGSILNNNVIYRGRPE